MAKVQYLVLASATPGDVAEFDRWYDEEHLEDVVAVEGVTSARRYRISESTPMGMPDFGWTSLAIYEIDAADPQAVLAKITETWYAGGMRTTDTLRMEPLLTAIAKPAGSWPRSGAAPQ